ncbi:MAG: DUF4197 domain-containing protein [Sphingomonadaceae bacterium]|nr:DUF4197 domain-containing protein [Sphingomonadaceae bacterium]
MPTNINRRTVLVTGAALPLASLAACTGLGGFDLTEAIRRVLTLSSQRAFATLLADDGFYDDQLARIELPDRLGGSGGGSILASILGTGAVRNQLLHLLNDAAAEGAERAAPIVTDAIRSFSVADALSIIRGGGDAATRALQGQMGDALVTAMFPEVGAALSLAENPILGRVLQAATGIDINGLRADVTRQAANGIYAAMGREEAAIRANPRATNDPVIIGAFGLL